MGDQYPVFFVTTETKQTAKVVFDNEASAENLVAALRNQGITAWRGLRVYN